NAAMAVVLDLDGRIDSTNHIERELAAIRAPAVYVELLPRPQPSRNARHAKCLEPCQSERLPSLALLKLQRQHAHADEVAAVDALVTLGEYRADAQERGSLGRPVPRAATAVLSAS